MDAAGHRIQVFGQRILACSAMFSLLLGAFESSDLFGNVKFDLDHGNETLIVRACHEFEKFELIDARHGQGSASLIDLPDHALNFLNVPL